MNTTVYADADEDQLVKEIQDFIASEYNVKFTDGAYAAVEADSLRYPSQYLIFNPTIYHHKLKTLYNYAVEVSEKSIFLIDKDKIKDDYHIKKRTDIDNIIAIVKTEGLYLYNNFKDDILYQLSVFGSFAGIYGVLEMLIKKSTTPFKENNLSEKIYEFYNEMVSELFLFTGTIIEKIDAIRDVAKYLEKYEYPIQTKFRRKTKQFNTLDCPNMNLYTVRKKTEQKFYIVSKIQRTGYTSELEKHGTLLAMFINLRKLPDRQSLFKIISTEEANTLLESMVSIFKQTEEYTAQLNARLIEVLRSISKVDYFYTQIIESMDVNDDLIYRNERVEYKNYTIEVKLHDNRRGTLTSFEKYAKVYRYIDMRDIHPESLIPFFRHPQIVPINTNWKFNNDTMLFFLKDSLISKEETNRVAGMNDLIFQMLCTNNIALDNTWFKTFKRQVKVLSDEMVNSNIFGSSATTLYEMEICLKNLKEIATDYLKKYTNAFLCDDVWYKFAEDKLSIFDAGDLGDTSKIKNRITTCIKLLPDLLNRRALPIKIIEEKDGALLHLLDAISSIKSKEAISVNEIIRDYQNNCVVKSNSFSTLIDRNGIHEFGADYMPPFVSDINSCFTISRKDVYRVREGKLFFQGYFYDYDGTSITEEKELNNINANLRSGQIAKEDMQKLLDEYKELIPAIFHEIDHQRIYQIYLDNFADMLEVYGYDMLHSNTYIVIVIDPANCPKITRWIKKLFHDNKNRLRVNNKRDVTFSGTGNITTREIPSFFLDEASERTVNLGDQTFYLKGDKPTLFTYKSSPSSSKAWLQEFIEKLDCYHFDFKLMPVKNKNKNDFYIIGAVTKLPIVYSDLFSFVNNVYPTIWKQIEKADKKQTANINTWLSMSDVINKFDKKIVNTNDWFEMIQIMIYIADLWLVIRNQKKKEEGPMCNISLNNIKTVDNNHAVNIVTITEFNSL